MILDWEQLTKEGADDIVIATARLLGTTRVKFLAGLFDIAQPQVVTDGGGYLAIAEHEVERLSRIIARNLKPLQCPKPK